MNTLNKLTVRRLKMNKKRTVVTVIGIILSTALLCAVAGMVTSFQETLKGHAKTTSGNFHVYVRDVNNVNFKYIENNRSVRDYFYIQDVGFSELEGSKNAYKPYLWLREYDEIALKNYGIILTSGRLPNNKNEVILSDAILSNGGVKYNLGDKITLKLGNRMFEDGEQIEDDNEQLQTCKDVEDGEECKEEYLDIFETREVTVVGFMARPLYQVESYNAPGYTMIAKLEDRASQADVAVLLKKPKEYRGFIQDFSKATSSELDYFTNRDLLRYEGILGDGTMNVLVTVSTVVFAIIIVSSVFVIKNSFTISVTERIREYGMLSSIGATKKQVRKSVLFEGFLLGIIGIPLGILSGILAVAVLLLLLNLILGDFIPNVNFVYHVPFLAIILSVGLSVITIYLSCIFPARKASKIAPIEAIRGNGETSLKRKQVKTPKFIKKFFSIGGDIAYKNLKRSRKKYRTTVVSLVVSIVLFLSLTALLDYGFKYAGLYYQEIDYNLSVFVNRKSLSSGNDMLEAIAGLENIERFSLVRSFDMGISIEKYANPELHDFLGEGDADVSIVSLGKEEYNRFLRHLGLNPDLYQEKVVLIDQVTFYIYNKYHDLRYLNVTVGDTITGKSYVDDATLSFEVGAITKERPMGISNNSMTTYLVVSDEFLEKCASEYQAILYVQSSNPSKLAQEIDELKAGNSQFTDLYVHNLEDDVRENNAMILVISIFLYGFIAVITLIGVTNIFNTITTNMALRKREFAMLRSVGMTKKEFNRMIRLESIFYGLKSLAFGLPIGVGLGYLIYRGIQKNLETPFVIPYVQMFICTVFVMLVVGITMHYSLKKINQENIIEVIRNDNI